MESVTQDQNLEETHVKIRGKYYWKLMPEYILFRNEN